MKKSIKRFITSLLAMALVFSSVLVLPAMAEEEETFAYIQFASSDWGVNYWNDGEDYAPVVAETAVVTGYGQYTVGLDFTGTEAGFAAGTAFMDVEIANGEAAFPDSYMTIDSLKINGEEVALGKTYTSSDDGVITRTNLFNEWVAEITEGRTADGDATDVTAVPFDRDAYPEIETIEVTFTLGEGVVTWGNPSTFAYIQYASADWSVSYWNDGNDYAPVVADKVKVTEYGQYTVSLDLTGTEAGMGVGTAFMDVEISNGEAVYPNSYMTIDSMKINGEEIALGKTYTSSDDGVITRTNLFNEWVAEIEEGRTADGDATDVTAVPFDRDAYPEIETVEITFTLGDGVVTWGEAAEAAEVEAGEPLTYVSFASSDWAVNYWNDGEDYAPVVATTDVVDGYGTYTVGLDFTGTEAGFAAGTAFLDVEIAFGELLYPNSYMTIDSLLINGEEVALGKTYTSSDDGIATRTNLFNEWVADIAEGRTADGDATDVTAIPFDRDAYPEIQTIEVTYTLGDGVETFAEATEEVDEDADPYSGVGSYMAFFQVQTSTWVYRDGFDSASTGYGSENFNTVYDNETSAATSTVVEDTVIDGDGVYQVALRGVDFAGSTDFNMVGISTNIPVDAGITISDAKLISNGIEVTSNGIQKDDNDSYLQVMMINQYDDEIKDTVNTMVPADGTDMVIEFTVSGFGYEKTVADATDTDTTADDTADDTTTADDTSDTTTDETAEDDSEGMSTGLIIAIVVGALVIIGGGVFALTKKKK